MVALMIEIREIGDRELEPWVALIDSVRPSRAGSVEDFLDWRRQAEDMAWFVATDGSRDVGAGFAYVGWHSEPGTGHGEAFVPAGHRGTGVGSALFHHIAGWVADRGCVVLETSIAEDDEESLAWADRRGFREVSRSSRLVLGLTAVDAPAVDPPEGVEITTWAEQPDLVQGIYEVASEAYPDEPGSENRPIDPFEIWLSKDMQGHSDLPEATFVAILGGEVVGYAKLNRSSAREGVAIHDMTGVKRAYRGRGIAGALKRAEIKWAKEQGFEKLETSNEARNEPIRRLNERYGYVVTPGEVVLREALSGPD
jgi:GNAT superfamily N-acetyltransferase